MPSFADIQTALSQTRFQKTIIAHLVEHLDGEFMPALDQQPRKVLLTDEKVRIPADAFEAVITNLNNWLKVCQDQEKTLLATNFTFEPPKQEEPPQEAKPEEKPAEPEKTEPSITPTSEAQP